MGNEKKEFGKRLAELRKSKKINQEEFKNLIDAPSVQMVSKWENGHSFPSANYLIIIAKRLDTSLDYLLVGTQNSSEIKTFKSYKDVAIMIDNLISSNLFKITGSWNISTGGYETSLISFDATIGEFKRELDNLMVASKTLRPELYRQARLELIDKYDIPLKLK